MMLRYLLKMLEPLVRLSLMLQAEDVTLADVNAMVHSTVEVLEQGKTK